MTNGNTAVLHPNATKPAPLYLNQTGQTVDEQKTMLERMVDAGNWQNRAEPYARMITITPQLAQHILDEYEERNRKRSAKKIEQYATSLTAGTWGLTGQPVIFSRSGKMLDGGHRLSAVVSSGKKLRTLAVFGVDDAAFSFLDIGRKRTVGNTLEVLGVANAGIVAGTERWIEIFTSGNPGNRGLILTNEETKSLWETRYKNSVSFNEAVELAIKVGKETIDRGKRAFPPSSLAAAFFLYAKDDAARWTKVRAFAEAMVNDGVRARSNAAKLVKRVHERLRAADGRLHENVRNIMICRALAKHMAGQQITTDLKSVEPDDAFPVIPKIAA